MIRRNFTSTKNSHSKDKDKPDINTVSYENNESNSINSFKTTKNKNILTKSTFTKKRKSGPHSKKENINNLSGNIAFKNLLNECLLNITQQASRKNIVNNKITKADKKFLKEYKLNYLNSRRDYPRSSSFDDNKSNISTINKNNNEIRKSSFHKCNTIKKNDTKSINLMNINSKFFPKKEQNLLKIHKANYDEIKNIELITNKSNSSSKIKFSETESKNSSSLNNIPKINLPKKTKNKKFSNKNTEIYKKNSDTYHSTQNLHKLDIEQSCILLDECQNFLKRNINLKSDKKKAKINTSKSIKHIKFGAKNQSSHSKPTVINEKNLFVIPEYLKHSTIICKEDIANLPFLNNNLSKEELAASSNLKEIIKKNIFDFKSTILLSSFENEGIKNLEKSVCSSNSKRSKFKSTITNKEFLSGIVIEKNGIKSKKISTRNKKNRKIKEVTNLEKNNKNQNNFLLEVPNTLQLLNEKKILSDNISVHTNNSDNTSINENTNSQIVLLNKNNQRPNIFFNENNESKNGKTNNNDFLKKVDTKLNNSSMSKYFMNLEIFRKLERKNIIYDSFDDEENDELDENTLCVSPNSFVVIFVDTYIAFSTIFCLITLPLHLARNKQFCNNTIFNFNSCLVYITEIIYFIDVIMGFFKKYYNFEEQLINDHSKIINHYLKGNFIFDLISSIPLLSIKILLKPKCTIFNNIKFSHKYYDCQLNNLSDLWKIIKTIKIIKILNDNVFIKFLYKCIDEFEASEKINTYITYISVVTISLHFATCLNIFISRNSYPNWITSLNKQTEPFSKIYVASLYHIMTSVTTVGYGDIVPCSFTEHIFQLIILLIGIIAYSWMVTSISNYINTNNEKYIEYENKLQILEDIKLKNPKIPNNLYIKILRHLHYGKKKRKDNYNIIFEILPYSLKNLLIYEIYKPIINNFTIFKNTHNSDFVISTIMAFKPFSAVKNDLIVKCGDILEEMIFVKKGKLSIEISINKKYQSQFIELYLSDQFFHDDKNFLTIQKKIGETNIISSFNSTILNHKNSCLMKNSTTFPNKIDLNLINKASSLELEENPLKKINEQQNKTNDSQDETNLRILDIRQNEYFGDILMFLGYKSPINIRVKSKNVELFLLSKVDAINISLTYKNIWNRINERSTYNIERIKLQIQKIVKQYCQSLGIKIDKNNKIVKINTDKKIKKVKVVKDETPKSQQITIISGSNDNNTTNSCQNFNSVVSNTDRIKQSEKSIYSIIKKIDDKKEIIKKKSNFANNKTENIEKQKNNYSLLDSEPEPIKKKKEYQNTELFKLSNGFCESSDVKSNEDKNDIKLIQTYKLGKKSSHISNDSKYLSNDCQSSIFNSDENNLTPFKSEEINDEIYPGEIFEAEINRKFNDEIGFLSGKKNYNNYSSNANEDLIKDNVQKINTKENISDKEKNIIKNVKYSNNTLTEIKNFSLEYKSMYENLNQLTKYQYSKNNELQSKIKILLENTCFNNDLIKKKDNSIDQINTKKTKILHRASYDINNNIEFSNDDSSPINKKPPHKKNYANSMKCVINNKCNDKNDENNNSNIPKKLNKSINKRRSSVSYLPSSSKKFSKENNNDIIETLKSRKTFRKSCLRASLFGNNNNSSIISHKKRRKADKYNESNTLLNMVNKNIIQNSQNINNPEMFYCDLFSNLIKNQKRSEINENVRNEVKNNNNNKISDKECQNCELNFIKKKTFSKLDFNPIFGEGSPKTRRKWKSKKYFKENINNLSYS